MTETEACIALNMIPRMGPVRLRKLITAFGSPQAILNASADTLRQIDGIGPEVARSIASWQETINLEAELRRIASSNITVLSQNDPRYPTILREIYDPPIVLYLFGSLEPRDQHAIGVVGTRKPTHYAQDATKKIAFQLAYSGITVVSGLALGIDTIAHQAALAAKGRTLAVIGSGLSKLYPPQNRELAAKIADCGGAVLSEFPLETSPDRQTFPMRNRIISGLSFGVLVVEAGVRSGALISASQAADQGRNLYVVPGRIDNPNAIGSNRLIQQGAKLITSAEDILEDMHILSLESPRLPLSPAPPGLTELETQILRSLETEELIIDQIVTKTGLPSYQISSTLLALEMRGLVKSLPGSRFVKLN